MSAADLSHTEGTNKSPAPLSSDLQEAIKKCFRDTYMETEGETELFDIDETITALTSLIQSRERAARIDEHRILDELAEATANIDPDKAMDDYGEAKDLRLATLSNNEEL